MKKIIAAITLAVALTAGFGTGPADAADRKPRVCTEDMACWNCHTMGNRICGPHNHALHKR